jgi:UDP-N-acetylglucosamine--N-acetylmuramyl-(pentapeptide) pyrophosphoryl-undecaprenol N-acetylglucosamine transferase
MSNLRVLIACGGTGGHLFPGIAVAEALQDRGHETLLLVSQKSIDAEALSRQRHLQSATLAVIGWPGWSPRLLLFLWRLLKGQKECATVFRRFKPTHVLGMGGFISAVPLRMARQRGLPTLMHESNAVPGKVTRLLARSTHRLLLGFAACAEHLPEGRTRTTGTPVRQGLRPLDKGAALAALGLNLNRFTILVMGGSQGAQGINRIVAATLLYLKGQQPFIQFLHLAGLEGETEISEAYQALEFKAQVRSFSHQMAEHYSSADLVISRSGAASLSEIGLFGLPSILIPFPEAAENHQVANANVFTRAGAAVMQLQAQLTGETLANLILELQGQPARRAAMSQAARQLIYEDAAIRVAQEVEQCLLS